MKKSAMVKVEIDINIPMIIVNVFGVQHVDVTLTQPRYEHHLIEFITQPCKIVLRMPMS
jgi:hypothetical protein